MKKLHTSQAGSHVVLLAIGVVILIGAIGFGYWRVKNAKKETPSQTNTQQPAPEESKAQPLVTWQYMDSTGEWKASGTPPACPSPNPIKLPVDLGQVESILYPGQQRSTGYKPHGGFKMKNVATTVKAPLDARVTEGSRYIEGGEVQYLFEFESPCGLMYRFDHLLTLSPEMQKAADKLPPAAPDDSRTTRFNEELRFKTGDVIATEVGHKTTRNYGFDFGVYDIRTRNQASKNPAYAAAHQGVARQAFFGVCWLDLLAEKTQLHTLPATDGAMGKTSDYCK